MAVTLSYPKPRSTQTKLATVAYTDTTSKELFVLPKYAVIVGIYVIGSAASGAVTSAVLDVGTTLATPVEYMTNYDVKTAATGEGYNPAGAAAVGSAMATPLTSDKLVYGKYTGVGGGDSGSWTIKFEYFVTGPGETL